MIIATMLCELKYTLNFPRCQYKNPYKFIAILSFFWLLCRRFRNPLTNGDFTNIIKAEQNQASDIEILKGTLQ